MQVSEAWLRDWVNPPWNSVELSQRLTMGGFEIEGRAPASQPFTNVVVGKVLECARHPKADKLSVCTVTTDGSNRLTIVCGAPNARAGLIVAVAMIGAELPGGVAIKPTRIRDIESQGMLCSARELGMGEDSDGILELAADLPLGKPLREALQLDDWILTVNVTPNRGDALSVRGLAREVAALSGKKLEQAIAAPVETRLTDRFPITLSAPESCPKFTSRVIRGVNARASSPLWLRERLRRAGLRSISAIVDVTNYTMLELGTPMHAYDLGKLDTGIDVRYARDGERITLLDGQDVDLDSRVLVIADRAGPVGIGGVMGGQRTAVSDTTTDVLFEMAWFQPRVVGACSRRLGLLTDAAQRFERTVDPRAQEQSMERAARLLIDIAGGNAGPLVVTEQADQLPSVPTVMLRHSRTTKLIGMAVPAKQIEQVLRSLEMRVEADAASGGDQTWRVTPPSHRPDITIEADLIEEVARIVGYDEVPEIDAPIPQVFPSIVEGKVPPERALQTLAARGYQEAITYTFVDPKLQAALFPDAAALALSNPIAADMSVMRVSLWPGLLGVSRENLRRQQPRIRFVEYGRKFVVHANQLTEIDTLSGVVTGPVLSEQWGEKSRPADFFDVKADLQALFDMTGVPEQFSFHPETLACLHPGRTARIYREKQAIGWLGELHPQLVRDLDFTYAPLVFELESGATLAAKISDFVEISRFPSIRRDIAVVVDEATPLEALREHVSVSANKLLRDLRVFDVYRGPGVESGRKSVALGLILQETTRTLTDHEADEVRNAVVARLRRELNASIRDQ